jgi:O-antigen/teichoic acid export membrane protein
MAELQQERVEQQTRDPRAPGSIGNAGWNAFATLWSIAISFVIAPVLIHRLGTSEYGTLLLVWSVTGVLGIVSCGFGEATLRYVARYHSAGDLAGVSRVFGSSLTFYIVVCSGVCIVLFGGATWLAPRLNIAAEQRETVAWLLRLAALVFSLGIIASAFAAVPMALQRYDVTSKISVGQSVVRSVGYIGLAISGFGIVHLVVWDVITGVAVVCLQVGIARKLLPDARLKPSWSFRGLREIAGYSVFSYLTFVFHSMYRESGKFVLGALLGPASVAFLGTPDSIAYRIYMVIVSGIETLMPRFSAKKDGSAARSLVLNGTWASLAGSISLLVPLAVLMPDFLKLWISPDFARQSALAGQLVALAFIAPAAFAPAAALLRGTGRPGLVTCVMAGAGMVTLGVSLLLVPVYGVAGVGYAYVASSVAWLGGVVVGWSRVFGTSMMPLARFVGVPLLVGAAGLVTEMAIRARLSELNWLGLVLLGAAFSALIAVLMVGADLVLGGSSPSRQLCERLAGSARLGYFRKAFMAVAKVR